MRALPKHASPPLPLPRLLLKGLPLYAAGGLRQCSAGAQGSVHEVQLGAG